MTLANVLVGAVRARCADTVFGVPGGGANLDVVGSATTAGLRFVLAHAETNGAIMAATYGLLTGRPAMAIGTRGPEPSPPDGGADPPTTTRKVSDDSGYVARHLARLVG